MFSTKLSEASEAKNQGVGRISPPPGPRPTYQNAGPGGVKSSSKLCKQILGKRSQNSDYLETMPSLLRLVQKLPLGFSKNRHFFPKPVPNKPVG